MRKGLLTLIALTICSPALADLSPLNTLLHTGSGASGPQPAPAVAAPVAAPVPVAPPEPSVPADNGMVPSFVGTYRCKGFDPYLNQDYAGTVTVAQQNTVYRLEMDYDTGEKSIGTGGLYDKHLLSVVFQDSTDPKHIGLEQYHFTDDYKTMSGYWVYLGKDKLGKEICDRVK